MEASYMHAFSTNYQHNNEAASPYMVIYGKFTLGGDVFVNSVTSNCISWLGFYMLKVKFSVQKNRL